MKDAFQVLQQKETELARVRKEIESLNIVAPLLDEEDRDADNADTASEYSGRIPPGSATVMTSPQAESADADLEFSSGAGSRSKFLAALKRAR
jgi:hypothetical protein